MALVSDAGTPGLSDPGFPLIRAAIEAGVEIVPIPGPSALLSALVASGLPMHAFTYLGFAPRKSGERRRLLERLADADLTHVVYESPHRLVADAQRRRRRARPDRPLVVGRELTKKFEEHRAWIGERGAGAVQAPGAARRDHHRHRAAPRLTAHDGQATDRVTATPDSRVV